MRTDCGLCASQRTQMIDLAKVRGLVFVLEQAAVKPGRRDDLSGRPGSLLTRSGGMSEAEIVRDKTSHLKSLRLTHFPKLRALAGLERLAMLEELTLESVPSYDTSGKYLVVDSLGPIASLKKLRVLRMYGVKAADASLAPLLECGALSRVEVGRGFPSAEYEKLRHAFPGATLVLPGRAGHPKT
jgi:hypothetical protein